MIYEVRDDTTRRDGWYVCTDHEDDDDRGPFYDEESAHLADRLLYFADEAYRLYLLSINPLMKSAYLAVHGILMENVESIEG